MSRNYQQGSVPDATGRTFRELEGEDNTIVRAPHLTPQHQEHPMYATIDHDTQTVHGVGETIAAAETDALKSTKIKVPRCLLTVPCTKAAADFIFEHGGAPSDKLTVTGHLVSLRSEEG